MMTAQADPNNDRQLGIVGVSGAGHGCSDRQGV